MLIYTFCANYKFFKDVENGSLPAYIPLMCLLSSIFTAHFLIVLPFARVSLSRCHFGWMLHLNFSFFWFSLCVSDQIYFKKKKTGGISFNSTLPLTHVDEKLCYQILHEYKIHNAEVLASTLHLGPREICMVYVHGALHFCLKYYVGLISLFLLFKLLCVIVLYSFVELDLVLVATC